MDRFLNVLLWAGLACFVLAFLLSGLYPYLVTDAKEEIGDWDDVTVEISQNFKLLKEQFPVAFARAYPEAGNALTFRELAGVPENDLRRAESDAAWRAAYKKALRDGRDTYVGEACWHCHSQYVRPVANEAQRFGEVLTPSHDNNVLQRPVLWGTRRVGPDLTHEGGRRSNDWHFAHFIDPRSTSPDSVMPAYSWFVRDGWMIHRYVSEEAAEREGLPLDTSYPYPGVYDTKAEAEAAMAELAESIPENLSEEAERLFVKEGKGLNETGLSVVAYLQWLGTWDPNSRKEVKQ